MAYMKKIIAPSVGEKCSFCHNTRDFASDDNEKKKIRKEIKIWSPYSENISKSDLIKKGHKELGNEIFKTWSCYLSGKMQCGKCESCNNRKIAFAKAKIEDKTKYLK